ncbi:hypothetical protein NC651_017770 [Populus alba x Populus x berolinensis]|nr:hypothetical protein NC651_017770 [Populus alba x Populus x berolinensis]
MDAETSSISRAPNHETREVIKQPTSLKEARDSTNQVINEKKRKLEEYEAFMVVLQVRMAVYQEKMAMLQENVNLTKKELHAAERIKETISNAKARVIYYTTFTIRRAPLSLHHLYNLNYSITEKVIQFKSSFDKFEV